MNVQFWDTSDLETPKNILSIGVPIVHAKYTVMPPPIFNALLFFNVVFFCIAIWRGSGDIRERPFVLDAVELIRPIQASVHIQKIEGRHEMFNRGHSAVLLADNQTRADRQGGAEKQPERTIPPCLMGQRLECACVECQQEASRGLLLHQIAA